MDNGWPKKRCYVKYKGAEPTCRHWLHGMTKTGCGDGMWQYKAKDGNAASFVIGEKK
jgi:hypothetical protein